MARARPARTSPDQLSLDDWEQMLNEGRDTQPPGERTGEPKRLVRQEATRADRPEGSGRADAGATSRSATVPPPDAAPVLLTTDEAAALLHVHPRTVQRLVERGELCAVHLGCAVRFDPQDIATLVERVKRGGRTAPAVSDPLPARRRGSVSFADRLRSQTA